MVVSQKLKIRTATVKEARYLLQRGGSAARLRNDNCFERKSTNVCTVSQIAHVLILFPSAVTRTEKERKKEIGGSKDKSWHVILVCDFILFYFLSIRVSEFFIVVKHET